MMYHGLLLIIATVISTAFAAANKTDCHLCAELATVEDQFKTKTDAGIDAYIDLQIKATKIIQKMPDKNGKLTTAQVKEIVAVIRLSVPNDPAEAILGNNIDIIDKNKAAFEKEIATLPAAERKEIELGLAVARSNQPDVPPKKK